MRCSTTLAFIFANACQCGWSSAFHFRDVSSLRVQQQLTQRIQTDDSLDRRRYLVSFNNMDTPSKHGSSSSLAAMTFDSNETDDAKSAPSSFWETHIQPVLSATMLITGSTVGASCLVLPETAQGPGMAATTALFVGAFFVNLISGLAIAQVAITQHETSGDSVPSSFKEFAEVNLQSETAGNVVSALCMFINTCVVSFDIVKSGSVLQSMVTAGVSESEAMVNLAPLLSVCFATLVAGLIGTQSRQNLSNIASVAVMTLFISFAGLLVPGLPHVQDPMGVFMTPGTAMDMGGVGLGASIAQAAPIVLFSMIYQNAVPTVTKILGYDRAKIAAALSLGSFIPLTMYIAWCVAVLGGGIDASSVVGGPLLTAFSLAALSGSAMGSSMALTEELEMFVQPTKVEEDNQKKSNVVAAESNSQGDFSLLSAIAAVSMPLTVGLVFSGGSGNFDAALSVAGAYGDPLLYGAIPVLMVWAQQQRTLSLKKPSLEQMAGSLVPGGRASLGFLGTGSVAFLCNEFAHDMGISAVLQQI